MTYAEIKTALRDAGIDTFATDARILLEEFCHADAASLPYADFTSPALADALRRRCAREPLQYIIGKWPFYKEEYFVSPACLIPRADTEVLAELLINRLPRGARFLDLCTGSGCIAISAAKNRPDVRATAADISADALKTAKRNALHNAVDTVNFIQADVTKPQALDGKFDCIVSNPPYIPSRTVDTLAPELAFEPRIALDGGADGLDFYRAILENFSAYLTDGGFFAFEFGYDQKADAAALAAAHGFSFEPISDLGGNFRVAVLKRK